jgi:hypothetical protein
MFGIYVHMDEVVEILTMAAEGHTAAATNALSKVAKLDLTTAYAVLKAVRAGKFELIVGDSPWKDYVYIKF